MAHEVYRRPCRQCGEDLVTTSTREVVHAACRKNYYAKYKRNPRSLAALTVRRARSRVLINEQPCVACVANSPSEIPYMLITKQRGFINPMTHQRETFNLCLRCLGEIRCGFMEPITWKRIGS